MTSMGVRDTRNHFSRVLDRVANGETITVTKRGVPVAKLVPVNDSRRPTPAEAIAAFREFRKREKITLGDVTIRELIEEGRV